MIMAGQIRQSPSAGGRGARRWRRGQSAVELAFAAPALALMLLAACDFGAVIFAKIELSFAARAGAEYGAQSPITAGDYAGMDNIAEQSVTNLSGVTASATSVCCPAGSNIGCTSPANSCSGQLYVKVTTGAAINPPIGGALGLPATVNLSASAQMPVK